MQSRFREIPEALENDAVIKLLGVMKQQIPVCFLSMEVRCKAISDVVYATAHLGRCDHVNQGARGIRYRDFDGTAPQRFQSKKAFGLDSVQYENRTLSYHAPFCDTPSGEDESLVKQLLGQFPVMSGCPTADVAWIEKRWCEDPWICEHLFATCQIQRDRNVKSVSYTS